MLVRILVSTAVLSVHVACFADTCTSSVPGLPGNYTICKKLRPHCAWDPDEKTCKGFWYCNDYSSSGACAKHSSCRWDSQANECTVVE